MRISILILTLLLAACMGQSDSSAAKYTIEGNWSVIEAKRNYKPTKLLDDLFFNFESNSLETNFPELSKHSFEVKNDSIFIMDHVLESIELISVDSVHLNIGFDFQEKYFLLKLKRT